MAKDFLLEIGLEEMPAHVIDSSRVQLEEKLSQFFADQLLPFAGIRSFSTPRRLAVYVEGLAEQQADTKAEVKGPARKIALDEQGNWTKAAEGFAKGQGLTTTDIYFKELNGEEYVHVTKFTKGKPAKEVLPAVKEIITSLSFPISMHWANYDFKYIRPIHWIVALLEEEIIPLQILDVKSDRVTQGHRFLGDPVNLKQASDYEASLLEQFVIADPDLRRCQIIDQVANLSAERNWQVSLDDNLLEEVTNLVEYPTVFAGSFAEKYLNIPEEVLVTSMKEHQRYFDVRDQTGKLLPYFISVRNGDAVHIENVIKGNEKVLTARLEDSEFFYQEDQKVSIETYVEKLKQVTFHEKIGSVYEKMQRTAAIAAILGKRVGLTDEQMTDLLRAASIYKFDLVTNMVGEFPELQGIMGEKYALLQGEKPAVAQAIREHYLPISSDGVLPESVIGSVLAVADKLDSVLCFFAVGLIPSGSNDPYALRRQTYGIIRIVEARKWTFPFSSLQNEIAELVNSNTSIYGIELKAGQEAVISFVKGRIKQWLAAQGIRHDVIEAVTEAEQDDLTQIFQAAQLLRQHLSDQDFKATVEALTRVINLARKNKQQLQLDLNAEVNPALFENPSELAMYEAVKKIAKQFPEKTLAENYQALRDLRPLIEDYFDHTMVMCEDEKVRQNRLLQLKVISQLALSFASLDQLVVK